MARLSDQERKTRKDARLAKRQRRDKALTALKQVAITTFRRLRKDAKWQATQATTAVIQTYKARNYVWAYPHMNRRNGYFVHHHDDMVAMRRNIAHARWIDHMVSSLLAQPKEQLMEWVHVGVCIGNSGDIGVAFGCADPQHALQTAQVTIERTRFQCTVWTKKRARMVLESAICVGPVLDIIMEYCDDNDHLLQDTTDRQVRKLELV